MVKIKKGNKTLEVTNSVFKNYYLSSGWEVIDEEVEKYEDVIDDVEAVNDESVNDSDEFSDEDWDSIESSDKPVSEMNGDELREYARILGIDTTGLNSNRKLREAINNSVK